MTVQAEAGTGHTVAVVGERSVVEEEHRIEEYDRVSELAGPFGAAAAGLILSIVGQDLVDSAALGIWSIGLVAAVTMMTLGLLTGRRTTFALPGYVLAGALWGILPLVGATDRVIENEFMWMVLAFQFATTAGVLGGSNVDDRLARAVLTATWGVGAVAFTIVGRPVITAASVVFLLLVDRDLRNNSAMVTELIQLRRAAALQAQLVARASLHDPMTGLYNRSGLEHQLANGSGFGAAMFVDLDRFKDINDRHGHHAGDRVLQATADRLSGLFRDSDLVARLGGDEFVVVLHGSHDRERMLERAAGVIAALEDPVDLDGEAMLCSASVGVAEIPAGDVDIDLLLRKSDHAMYSAKRTGRRKAVLFGDELRDELEERAELTASLRSAVRLGGLEAWGQPIIDTATGSVFGVELLARWRSSSGEWIPPVRFIPVAEEIGMSADITRFMLARAVTASAAWTGHPVLDGLRIGLNVSGHDLRGGWLTNEVTRALRDSGVDAGRLVVEITESSSLHQDEAAGQCLEQLHLMGVTIALDDFGTGYSSISNLVELPLDVVKLDRSLTSTLVGPSRRYDVVASIGQLASNLGRYVVAEGVETAEEADAVARLGFRFAQGYYFCAPMALGDLAGDLGRVALSRYSGNAAGNAASH